MLRSALRSALAAALRPTTGPGIGGGGSFTPALWFLASEQGIWLDPSDMSTLFQDTAGTTPVTAVEQPVGRILDKSGNGNHATQATTASRPVLSARKNWLLASEDFSAAVWGKITITIVANSAAASDGSITADKLVPAATNAVHMVYANAAGVTVAAGQRWTGSVDLKADGCGFCYVEVHGGAAKGFCVNLTTGAITDASAGLIAGTVENLGNGWWRANVTEDTAAVYVYLQLYPRAAAGGAAPWLGDGINGVLMSRAQLEAGPVPTAYQRVTTATDYDSVGFPHYAKLDRVDDNITAAAGGGGTTGIIICAAIRASGAGNARTIWSDRGTNTGYRLSINASNQLVLSAGNGTAHTEVIGPTITAGTDYVVAGWHDGTNLNVQLNAGVATSAAFGTATAGTAGFTIGRDNGAASGYYGDRIYEIVYRKDDTSSAGDRTSLITYMAEQAGITL